MSSTMWQAEEDGRKALLKDQIDPAASRPPDQGMLQDYSADFVRLRSVAVAKVQALKQSVGSKTWADDVRAAERALEAMESNRRQMQVQLRLELSGTAGNVRQEWDQRLQEWAREVASFRGELEAAREQHGRRTLQLHGRELVECGADSASQANRQSAFESTGLLEQGTRKLQEAMKQVIETEAVGGEVMSDLNSQRETIQGVRGKMRTIGTELTQARQSLNRMLQRAQQHRLVTLSVCLMLGFGVMFWVCSAFGLPLRYTALLATASLLIIITGVYLKSKLQPGTSG